LDGKGLGAIAINGAAPAFKAAESFDATELFVLNVADASVAVDGV
jgi:hypothetical protein